MAEHKENATKDLETNVSPLTEADIDAIREKISEIRRTLELDFLPKSNAKKDEESRLTSELSAQQEKEFWYVNNPLSFPELKSFFPEKETFDDLCDAYSI